MKLRIAIISALTALTAVAAHAAGDSIRVVKGQVSDYYINVVPRHSISGIVTDTDGNPLRGATVMFFASPAHVNTDADGSFSLTAAPTDTALYVFYPGKKLEVHQLEGQTENVKIVLRQESERNIVRRTKAVPTQWYDADNYNPQTFCNPINISYNFEPYNNNVNRVGGKH